MKDYAPFSHLILLAVLSHQGFFFVDKRFEISNLDLIRDLEEIIKLEKRLLGIQ